MIKLSKIKKLPEGKYRVLSGKGKNLGTFPTFQLAKKRLIQIEYFKHRKSELYLTADEKPVKTFSEIVRNLQKEYPDLVKKFLFCFKQAFDEAIELDEIQDLDQLEQACILQALADFKK